MLCIISRIAVLAVYRESGYWYIQSGMVVMSVNLSVSWSLLQRLLRRLRYPHFPHDIVQHSIS